MKCSQKYPFKVLSLLAHTLWGLFHRNSMICYLMLLHCRSAVTSPTDDIMETVGFKSGSSTPQRSGSTAGLHRPRLSIDSASPAIDLPQLSSSLPGSLSGSSPLLAARQGSHTMDFFEMCASLITTLARWEPAKSQTALLTRKSVGVF